MKTTMMLATAVSKGIGRRDAFRGLAAAAAAWSLPGCVALGQQEPVPPPASLPAGAIDMHAHIFNARDVPVAGFIDQVIARSAHKPPTRGGTLIKPLIRLLTRIMLSNTPTAAQELALLRRIEPEAIDAEAASPRSDEANVRRALEAFQSAPFGTPEAVAKETDAAAAENARLMRAIRRDLALPPPDPRQPEALQTEAARIANAIYAYRAAESRTLRGLSSLIQTIRWAGLLTQSRQVILGELLQLYGGDGGVAVFSPSTVDFELWFNADDKVSPLGDQLAVMSELARRTTNAVLLNFAPFCPLRAALAREDGTENPLDLVKDSIRRLGFVGVKVYPPMGFEPLGNAGVKFKGVPRAPKDGGAALDRELHELYAWCSAEDIPIKAHAINSIARGKCTGKFAAPENWRPVLAQFPKLKLNLAHFGGFEETLDLENRCRSQGPDWETMIARMVGEFPNVYYDLGYWTEIAGPKSRKHVLEKTRALLLREPLMATRMMYGSDWSMIGREPAHPQYLVDTTQALSEILRSKSELTAVMRDNARRYLGLTKDSSATDRLSNFFGPDHPFHTVFA